MRIALVLAAAIALPLSALAQGSNPNLGRNLAATCAGCHNTAGKSLTGMPAIAGLPKETIVNAVRDFRDGKRSATVMQQHAKGYTDPQIELIAAYFAAQK